MVKSFLNSSPLNVQSMTKFLILMTFNENNQCWKIHINNLITIYWSKTIEKLILERKRLDISYDKKSTNGTFSFAASVTMSGRVNVNKGATLFLPPETDLRSTVEGNRIISGDKTCIFICDV